jgi:hypothetical protein
MKNIKLFESMTNLKEIDNKTSYHIFVKGEDDFGRAHIGNDGKARYAVNWLRPKVGDIMHFLYPKEEAGPLYIVTKETSHWTEDDDAFTNSEGEMQLFPPTNGHASWQSWIDANTDKHYEFVEKYTQEANRRYTAARKK